MCLKNVVINPRRACAARVTVVGLSVCLCVCVCVSTLILALQATRRPISDTKSLLNGNFPERTAFESEKLDGPGSSCGQVYARGLLRVKRGPHLNNGQTACPLLIASHILSTVVLSI